MKRIRLSDVAAWFIIVGIAVAVFAPLLTAHDPTAQDLASRFVPPVWYPEGSAAHLLGTDHLGRDVLTRTMFGARISLLVGLCAATAAALFGLLTGLVAGFYQNWFDRVVTWSIDVQLAFPLLLLAVVVVGIVGPSVPVIIAVLSLWGWAAIARVARAETMSRRNDEYIEASHIVGSSSLRLMGLHLLPNILPSAVVLWTVAIGQMIVLEGALSFIGLGISPPTPSWGNMINEGRQVLNVAWWVAVIPGIALILTVLAFNTVGDAVGKRLDPRGNEASE